MVEIKNLPEKYQALWEICLPLLEQGRSGDAQHAKEVAEFILNYQGQMNFDLDVLIPTAMMHDIGHSAILPEHFEYITGFKKVVNGKLVHMLVGAKIAHDLLKQINYNLAKAMEIVDIISIHDADQLTGLNVQEIYNTEHKKIFHDIDSLDRFNLQRLSGFVGGAPNPEMVAKTLKMLEKFLSEFFYPEFRAIAETALKEIRQEYEKF